MRLFPPLVLTCCLAALVTSASAELVISEVMARGGHDLEDEDGDRTDWIELFNSGSEAVSLQAFALTDDPDDMLKWKLPERSLEAGAFLTIHASGKDRRGAKGNLHTDFKLDGDGEYLALVRIEDKSIIHSFDPYFPIVGKGESFGFEIKDGRIAKDRVVFFRDPTPGKTNGEPWVPVDATTSGEELTLDEIFPTDRVIDVQITLTEEDWDTIRHQSRNLFEVLSEKRKEAPIDHPYVYVEASVTIDGHRFPKVGLRKKGFIGSQSDSRPSLKIKLNHVDKDGGIEGLTNLTMNNNKQDPTLVNQHMGYAMFNAAGAPAPRSAFVKVTVNGTNLGIYTHVESIRKPLIKREMGTDKGTLYEGTVVDFREGWGGSFEKKFGSGKRGRMMIEKLIEVLEGDEVDRDPIKAIGELVDLDSFYAYWAVEGLLGFWDGYTGNHNNFFVYFNPEGGKFHFVPWGADALFDKFSELEYDEKAPISVKTKGMIAHKLYQSEAGRERYAKTLKDLLKEQWNEEALLAETDRIEALLKPHLAPIQANHARKLEEVREFIRGRRADLVAEISDGMPIWTKVPEPPPVIPSSFAEGWNSDSIWNSAKTGNIDGIKAQLAKDVDVNARDPLGSLPLALAALTGKTEAVRFLLSQGADVNAGNNENQTALHSAAFLGQLEVIKALIENKVDVNARNDDGETPLDAAEAEWSEELQGIIQFIGTIMQVKFDLEEVKAGRPKVVALLRKHGAKSGTELPKQAGKSLWESVKLGDLYAIKRELAEDASAVDKQDKNGITPLSWAALAGRVEAARLLISKGANVNAKNRDGATSLHSAAFLGHLDIVELLIEKKAEVNAKNGKGDTALNSVATEWSAELEGIIRFIAGFLKIEVDVAQIKEARPKIAALLRKHAGNSDAEIK